MERTKYLLTALLLFLIMIHIHADYKSAIYKAYISNDMGKWKKTMDEMARVEPATNDVILELVNYQYGYIGWCIGMKNKKEAGHYLALAKKNIELLQKKSYKPSSVNAFLSAMYGFEIGLNTMKAPFIGPKSVKCAELAMELDKMNPYGFIQYAHSQYYMPAAFGGSKQVAIEHYLKAEKIMEQQKEKYRGDWNYLNLLAVIARAMEAIGKDQQAKQYYEKILKTEPGFLWVKNELYPAFLKRIQQK